jgi:hypothetical protein
MPLKLPNLTHPSSTGLLNKWADENDHTVQQHSTLLRQLQKQITDLQKSQTP